MIPLTVTRDRTGDLTPPLPCPQCRALFPMTILSWQGHYCDCRPDCDSERADATVRCTGCGGAQDVGYADEGSEVALDEWFGGKSHPYAWHLQVWQQWQGPPLFSIIEPLEGSGADNQWLAEIADLLDNDAYEFPSPKDFT